MVNSVLLGSQAPSALIETLERGQSVFEVTAISKTLQCGPSGSVFVGRIEGSACVVKSYQKSKLTDAELCQVREGLWPGKKLHLMQQLFCFFSRGLPGGFCSLKTCCWIMYVATDAATWQLAALLGSTRLLVNPRSDSRLAAQLQQHLLSCCLLLLANRSIRRFNYTSS